MLDEISCRARYLLGVAGCMALMLLTAAVPAYADAPGASGATSAAASSSSSASSSAVGGASAITDTCGAPYPNARVRVTTSMGDFVIQLDCERAPFTVTNFLRYVREGQYTNTLFHRVISNFVIQGGGHDATTFRLKPTHLPIPNESGNGLQNKRGTVGLARANKAHSGNCQFYVNLVDNPELDPLPTRWGYAVFGKVIEGMDVVDRIGITPTGTMGPFKSDAPLKPVVIEKVELLPQGAVIAEPQPFTRPANSTPPVASPQ
ncbi:MAG: peptidylprolyl isomerase [Steroidobacteraceae bacterium]